VDPIRGLVDPPLAGSVLGEAEVFDRIRPVHLVAGQPGLLDGLHEQPAGRPDERRTLPVLLVARLLADQHDPGRRRPGREHGLGGRFPQLAAAAAPRRGPQLVEAGPRWDEVGGAHRSAGAPLREEGNGGPSRRTRGWVP
jgi:hypothetical protein